MPVVRSTYDHGVNIFVLQQLAVLVIDSNSIERFASFFSIKIIYKDFSFIGAFLIKVTHGHHLRLIELPHPRQVVVTGNAASSYRTNIYPVAGGIFSKHARRYNRGKPES